MVPLATVLPIYILWCSAITIWLSIRTIYWLRHWNRKYANPQGFLDQWKSYNDKIQVLSITTKPSFFELAKLYWNYEVEMLINGKYFKVSRNKNGPIAPNSAAKLAWYSATARFEQKKMKPANLDATKDDPLDVLEVIHISCLGLVALTD